MSLAKFINDHTETLIEDWMAYAESLQDSTGNLSAVQLRNSAAEILASVVANMNALQTPLQQDQKAQGAKRDSDQDFDAVSSEHADDRLSHGFGLNDVVAEYRALRASVLRRWEQSGPSGSEAFREMIRFNEAIDQALAESVRQYTVRTDRIRDLFAGVLAHDLRSPLGVLLNSAEILLRDESLAGSSLRASAYVQRSAARMRTMIDDLLIFTRTRLGDPTPIHVTPQHMDSICRDAAEEMRVLFPQADIAVHCDGELSGRWDAGQIGQLLFNLLSNAIRYGNGAVRVTAQGQDGWIVLTVANDGDPLPPRALPTLFDPLTRATTRTERMASAAGIGLGLYICRCVATSHGGSISVQSDEQETAFTVRIPRHAKGG